MKHPNRITALAGAFGVAALTTGCIAGEGGEGGGPGTVRLDPGSLVFQPPSLRVQGHGGEGGEGG